MWNKNSNNTDSGPPKNHRSRVKKKKRSRYAIVSAIAIGQIRRRVRGVFSAVEPRKMKFGVGNIISNGGRVVYHGDPMRLISLARCGYRRQMDRYLISHRGESHSVLEPAYMALMYGGFSRVPLNTRLAIKGHTVLQPATDSRNETTQWIRLLRLVKIVRTDKYIGVESFKETKSKWKLAKSS